MHKVENKKKLKKPISLVGMPGSGKSTIGRYLANVLECPFVDSDALIEKQQGIAIPEIFKISGEPFFRNLEKNTILETLANKQSPYILSTGGGAVMTDEIKDALLAKSIMVFLNVSLGKLWAHLEVGYKNRPLLADDDPKQRLENLLEKRLPVYKQAHITLDCDNLGADEIAKQLIEKLDDIS